MRAQFFRLIKGMSSNLGGNEIKKDPDLVRHVLNAHLDLVRHVLKAHLDQSLLRLLYLLIHLKLIIFLISLRYLKLSTSEDTLQANIICGVHIS